MLSRVLDIARDLANQPQDTPNVRSRLNRFERYVWAVSFSLEFTRIGRELCSVHKIHMNRIVFYSSAREHATVPR